MERTVTAINAAMPQERKIRTAAYCRVSSDSADQLHSFSAQVRYYTRLIGDNECITDDGKVYRYIINNADTAHTQRRPGNRRPGARPFPHRSW